MMKIAFISNNIPLPEERNGNTVNIINIIRELKKRNYTIDFYLFSDDLGRDNSFIKEFKNEVDSLICRRHVSKYAFWVNFFRKKIKLDCPAFYCNFNTGYYYPLFKSDFSILYAADSVAYQYSKQKGIHARFWQAKMFVEEKSLYKHFKKVVFVSPLDLAYSKLPESRGIYIPIGYHLDNLTNNECHAKKYDLIFSGSYDYFPNHDAYDYFIKDIFPLLLKQKPNIKVCFVGRNPSEEMIKDSNTFKDNIIVTGEVESVIPYLQESKVFISPLRKGSGMKNKILQAMIAKLPIVCTSESITGLSISDESSIMITDDTNIFVEYVINLLRLPAFRLDEKGELNYNLFVSLYTWKAIVDTYYNKLFNGDL